MRSGEDTLPEVAIFALDGMTWNIIDPLLKKGHLPNFERLIDGGVRGDLVIDSDLISPVIWTTVATGKRPSEHGIEGFTRPFAKRHTVNGRPTLQVRSTVHLAWPDGIVPKGDVKDPVLHLGGPVVCSKWKISPSELDITPTVLAIRGRPVADDMPGRPLSNILSRSFVEAHPPKTVPTHEKTGAAKSRGPSDTRKKRGSDIEDQDFPTIPEEIEELVRQRLSRLGYI